MLMVAASSATVFDTAAQKADGGWFRHSTLPTLEGIRDKKLITNGRGTAANETTRGSAKVLLNNYRRLP
jgi:hypothetical protein